MQRGEFLKRVALISTVSILYPGISGANRFVEVEPQLSSLTIRNLADWELNRKVIEDRWLSYLGALPNNPSSPRLLVLKEDNPDGLVRQLVEYEGEPGLMVQGYLIRPSNIRNRLPGVVVRHSSINEPLSHISGVETGKVVPWD